VEESSFQQPFVVALPHFVHHTGKLEDMCLVSAIRCLSSNNPNCDKSLKNEPDKEICDSFIDSVYV
jgi:hypothetical protein